MRIFKRFSFFLINQSQKYLLQLEEQRSIAKKKIRKKNHDYPLNLHNEDLVHRFSL